MKTAILVMILAAMTCPAWAYDNDDDDTYHDYTTVTPRGDTIQTYGQKDGWLTVDENRGHWRTQEFGNGYVTVSPDGETTYTVRR